MEPKACLAAYDAKTGTFDIYMPTQGMSDIRREMAHVTGLAPERFRIHAKDVGGAFGVRNEVYPEFAALAFAAQALGRPVKWIGTRAESMVSDHHARGVHLKGELALDDKGNFLGMRVEWQVNVGAYARMPGRSPTRRRRRPEWRSTPTARPRSTGSTGSCSPTRRPPRPIAAPAGPACRTWRSGWWTRPRASPASTASSCGGAISCPRRPSRYKTPTGSTYDSGDPPALLADALKTADWDGFAKRRAEAKTRGRLRGIGCATFIEPSGGVGQEEIAIRFDRDGLPQLFTLAGPSGQGHETVFVDLVAEIFGMAPDKVALRYSDPDSPPLVGTGSFGSRSLLSHGSALSVGAHEVVQKGLALAAKDLEVADRRHRVRAGPLPRARHRPVDRLPGASAQARRRREPPARHHGQGQHVGGVSERRPYRGGRDRSRHRRARYLELRRDGRLRTRRSTTPSSRASFTAG